MAGLYIALLHFPMRNREGKVTVTALTSLDVPDIARTARTYNVKRFYIVHPVESQRRIAARLRDFWVMEEELPTRREALELVAIREDLEEVFGEIAKEEGEEPVVLGTTARAHLLPYPKLSWEEARRLIQEQPTLVLFGTGHGMSDELLAACDALLPAVRASGYNHLSVRAAVAIILDRLKGEEP
ncbi:RNA methyltransferase [Candidatus Bipolaricaulota bacterium]|nr:RNA methyltransferase [Candidatus Bipolaricaulota bacterium]